MKLYVTLMQRWGDPENHHYIEGVYLTKEEADKKGNEEHDYRGGKYDHIVIECGLNSSIYKRNKE